MLVCLLTCGYTWLINPTVHYTTETYFKSFIVLQMSWHIEEGDDNTHLQVPIFYILIFLAKLFCT